MIAFYLTLPLVLVAVIRLLVVLFNFLSKPYLPVSLPKGSPMVSVLVPTRNEEANIANLLNGLQLQEYSNMEILVYNDESTDSTAAIVEEFANADSRIRLINGDSKPEGWMGKNYACHRLSEQARGDYFLFLDADVAVKPSFIGSSLAYLESKRLTLLSMFPHQQMGTWGERVTVPVMQWVLLSLLPLRFVMWSKRRSLAAANGQVMLFDAHLYKQHQWHQQFKDSAAEDIAISRGIKRARLRMATLLGSNDVSCRMYHSYTDAVTGFAKNVCQYFGGNRMVMAVFALLSTFGFIPVLYFVPFPLVFVYLFAKIFSRMLVAYLTFQKPLVSVLLQPVQQLAFLQMVWQSLKIHSGKELIWKGRAYSRESL